MSEFDQPPIAEFSMHSAIASTAVIGVSAASSLLARLPRGFCTGVAAGKFNANSGGIGWVGETLFFTFMADLE
jgi:hypothetical protein